MTSPRTLSVRVHRKQSEAEDIVSLELGFPDHGALPAFAPGAHIDVHIKPGLTRQYSLCNSSAERHRYLISVLRDPASRGGSTAMHDAIQEGDRLEISLPKNHLPLTRARRTLLLAGGIGVTPLLCMADQLAQHGADFELHYCTRSIARTAFRNRIAASDFVDQVHYHFDDGDERQKLNLDDLLELPDAGTHLYVCGPHGFIDSVCAAARDCGWRDANVHFEHFGAPAVDHSGDRAFEVEIAGSGEVLTIPPGQSVAEVLRRHGIEIETACRRGVCGTCMTHVLDGVPEHRDYYLNPEEKARNDQFMPCCSRAKDRLVLDL